MTLTKESLREALDSYLFENDERRIVRDAARFVERLLPEKCYDPDCPGGRRDCGQVWDEGLVKVVKNAIDEWKSAPYEGPNVGTYDDLARAVLSALAEEVSEVSRDT